MAPATAPALAQRKTPMKASIECRIKDLAKAFCRHVKAPLRFPTLTPIMAPTKARSNARVEAHRNAPVEAPPNPPVLKFKFYFWKCRNSRDDAQLPCETCAKNGCGGARAGQIGAHAKSQAIPARGGRTDQHEATRHLTVIEPRFWWNAPAVWKSNPHIS